MSALEKRLRYMVASPNPALKLTALPSAVVLGRFCVADRRLALR